MTFERMPDSKFDDLRQSTANPQVERLNPPDWHEWVKTLGVRSANETRSEQKQPIEDLKIPFESRPAYGANLEKTKDAVENYGDKLDYRDKNKLESLITESALGKTKEFGETLLESSPQVRSAFANFLRKEADCYVELRNGADGSYSFSAFPKGSDERLQFSFKKDGEHSWGQSMASCAWLDGQTPIGMDPWVSQTDSTSVDKAFHQLSAGLSKYLVEIGQWR